MPSSADIVIVGGGVVGSSVAYHLREVGCRGRIVVIERDHTYARASSNLAMGGIRQQFTLDVKRGYLFLADANSAARLTQRYEAMRSAGAHVEWVSGDETRVMTLGGRPSSIQP